MDLSEQEKSFITNFRRTREYEVMMGLFTKRLDKYKTMLIDAKGDAFCTYQGRAQEQRELIRLFTSNS